MQFNATTINDNKFKIGLAVAILGAALATALISASGSALGGGTTFVVDDDGLATPGDCESLTPTLYTDIQPAVTAASAGDTIKVCSGPYTGFSVDRKLYLKGAKAGVPYWTRTFGNPSESTVTGLVTIDAADVKLDGYSLTNPNQGLGVLVKATGNGAVIKKNIVNGVGGPAFANHTVGVYLELGPDNVTVKSNKISNIQSANPAGAPGTAQGILVGDSSSGDPSLNTNVQSNNISDIQSSTRGAYGIQVNNGASTVPTATGYSEVKIRGNKISDVSGAWARGVGLEGETPNAVVRYNKISNLNSPPFDVPGDIPDAGPVPTEAAVFFEDNPFFFTSNVNRNSLAVGTDAFGIVIAKALTDVYVSLSVDGECNWWGASNGPGAVASGSGSLVGPNVDYKPWLKSDNLKKWCGDKKFNDGDHHHGAWDWGDWDHWDDD